jgi:hypothetical protein
VLRLQPGAIGDRGERAHARRAHGRRRAVGDEGEDLIVFEDREGVRIHDDGRVLGTRGR